MHPVKYRRARKGEPATHSKDAYTVGPTPGARLAFGQGKFGGMENAMADHIEETSPDMHDAPPPMDEAPKSPIATQTTTPTRRPSQLKPGKLPPWKVVLHNDHNNTMQDVVGTIRQLTPLSEQAAVRRMLEAHARGRALLMTTHRERAELYKDQFASKKMIVTIGPA